MRVRVSAKVGKSAAKAMFAMLLASSAAGCSSDVSRFGGLFTNADNVTTNSIPRHTITDMSGQAPVPQTDVASTYGGNAGSAPVYRPPLNEKAAALGQAYPPKPYDTLSTGTTSVSQARLASTPVAVERTVLEAPSAAPAIAPKRAAALAKPSVALAQPSVALAQPMPAAPSAKPVLVAPSKSGWSAEGAPTVTLRPGETVAGLARRYGVPEKEILRVNGLASAGEAQVGQQIMIPTFGKSHNAAKDAARADIPAGKLPKPGEEPVKETAALPGSGTARGKQLTDATGKLPQAAGGDGANAGPGGTYTVKPGDSLAKIARATGTRIDALKAANGLTASAIGIGQVLKLPGAGTAPAGDDVKTASIPAKPAPKKEPTVVTSVAKAENVNVPAKSGADAAPKQAVGEVASANADVDIPEDTGIGKFRWPVRGQVIAGYGSNVDGNRNDGIDISVPAGTPIKAAENGVVIYAGNGLKELGNTVLVRHDDGTVTVYGNANTLKVARGQKVQRGQTVAESGMTGNAKRPQVHFEVRKDAAPVNPMTFLD